MNLSPRERNITIVVGAVVLLFMGDRYVWTPYTEASDKLREDLTVAQDRQTKVDKLLKDDRTNRKTLQQMIDNGLITDPSAAESQMVHAIDDWGRDARLTVQSVKRDRMEQDKQFGRIVFRTTWTGNMASVARFLWNVQTSKLPTRVTDLQVTTRQGAKEGSDDLQLSCVISTLVRGQVPGAATQNSGGGAVASASATAGGEVRK